MRRRRTKGVLGPSREGDEADENSVRGRETPAERMDEDDENVPNQSSSSTRSAGTGVIDRKRS